jgi:hypothetical protein
MFPITMLGSKSYEWLMKGSLMTITNKNRFLFLFLLILTVTVWIARTLWFHFSSSN